MRGAAGKASSASPYASYGQSSADRPVAALHDCPGLGRRQKAHRAARQSAGTLLVQGLAGRSRAGGCGSPGPTRRDSAPGARGRQARPVVSDQARSASFSAEPGARRPKARRGPTKTQSTQIVEWSVAADSPGFSRRLTGSQIFVICDVCHCPNRRAEPYLGCPPSKSLWRSRPRPPGRQTNWQTPGDFETTTPPTPPCRRGLAFVSIPPVRPWEWMSAA